jgi:hypothetical protein
MQSFRYIGPLILSSFCLVFSFQEDIQAKANSDLNKEVQPGRGAQSTLRKEVWTKRTLRRKMIG